jgi:Smg protein
MFEVLVFVYENYWRGDACPELPQLGRKLSALVWLDGLNSAAQAIRLQPEDAATTGTSEPASATADAPHLQSPDSLRVYSIAEQDHLGAQCLGFISFLESSGVLPPALREIVLDRAMAAPGDPVALDELKIIVLMVYWSFGTEVDALVLDELCDDTVHRVAH